MVGFKLQSEVCGQIWPSQFPRLLRSGAGLLPLSDFNYTYPPTMRSFALLCLVPSVALAFQLPFKVPFLKSKLVVEEPISSSPRIAIIGAGAGGSSAAFWISKAKERFGVDVEVDVYEKESYIGGREFGSKRPSFTLSTVFQAVRPYIHTTTQV